MIRNKMFWCMKPLRCASVAFANAHHHGFNVYHDRDGCLAVLRHLEQRRPGWWTAECSGFVDQVAMAPIAPRSTKPLHPLIVVEGLDAVGKTTVTNALVERLRGTQLVRTPDPSLESVRSLFRGLEEPLARAFYCGANYIAAPLMMDLCEEGPVVVDRWWCSTCAMALASCKSETLLPPPASGVYLWPSDLPRFDVGALLFVDERVRTLRMKKRSDEHPEEALLAAEEGMRRAAMSAYQRFGLLHLIEVPNYRTAVNNILCIVRARGFDVQPESYYSAEEVAAVKPF